MNFLRYFLYVLTITSTFIIQANAMDQALQGQYPMLAPTHTLPPCKGKSVTIICSQDGTKIHNVPLSLLKDDRITLSFPKIIQDLEEVAETLTDISIPNIDRATLRSTIHFMSIVQKNLALKLPETDSKSLNIQAIKHCLRNHLNQPMIMQHYRNVATHLQFNLLLQALGNFGLRGG